MSDPPSPTPSGWFPDPLGRHEHRYFNGTAWTADVADGGQRHVDPYGAGPPPYDPGQYGGGEYGGPMQPTRRNGIAVAAMVCGIIGILLAWMPFIVVIGLVLAILALVFGIRGLRRSSVVGVGRGPAIAGIVTGGVGLALAILGVVLSVMVYREVADFVEAGPVTISDVTCEPTGGQALVRGHLTNDSRTSRGYTVFVKVGGSSESVTIDGVAPDATVSWSARVNAAGVGDACDAEVDVYGPFPFGVEVDPIEQ